MIIYSSLFSFVAYILCIWCLARSFDLTHLWCLGLDLNPVGDVYHEVPVVDEYGWGPVDLVVEPEDGAPAQGV